MYKFVLKLLFLAILGGLIAQVAEAQTNAYVHVYYYGWFPGGWNNSDKECFIYRPTAADECPGPEGQACVAGSTGHLHLGSSHNDIGAVYFPKLGLYNTSNVLTTHGNNINSSGSRSSILSFGRPGQPDPPLVTTISNAFGSKGIKSTFAIRAYGQGDIQRDTQCGDGICVQNDILELALRTSPQPRVSVVNQYRVKFDTWMDNSQKYRPIFYIYAPKVFPAEWPVAFCKGTGNSFRDNNRFIALSGHHTSLSWVKTNCFDGYYNYTPNDAKDIAFYRDMTIQAWQENMIFSAGVSPGYSAKRTKNDDCTGRDHAAYKDHLGDARLPQTGWAPHFVSIVTFNEWNEGSQIEPAYTLTTGKSGIKVSNKNVGQCTGSDPEDCGFQYLGYDSTITTAGPNIYLNTTNNMVGDGKWWPKKNGVDGRNLILVCTNNTIGCPQ